MSKFYLCPRCNKRTLQITEKFDKLSGECKNCGYTFLKNQQVEETNKKIPIIPLLKEWSVILAIIAIILCSLILANMNTLESSTNTKIQILKESITTSINNISSKLDSLSDDFDDREIIINDLLSRLSSSESSYVQLYTLYNDTQQLLESLNATIQSFNDITEFTNVSVELTNYQNQSSLDGTYYAHLSFDINSTRNLSESEIIIYYPNSNISIDSTSLFSINQTYINAKGILTFGNFKEFDSLANITWNSTNASKILSHTNLRYIIKLNDIYITDIDFEIKTVD